MASERATTAMLMAVLAVSAVAAVLGFALLRPAAALGQGVQDQAPALVLAGDPPGTVHTLTRDSPALWNVGVTLHRMPVSTVVGILTANGGLAAADVSVPTEVELLGCAAAWSGTTCSTAERVILPVTPTDALPDGARSLSGTSGPVPASMWVQARVTMPPDAPADASGRFELRLTVDATGADEVPAGGLAPTGSSPLGPALLGVAAVAAGFAVAGLARRRRRG